jgi:hypothetical protein
MPEQRNDQKGSFQAKKIKNDKPLPAYAHADAINHEMERPVNAPLGQRMTHGGDDRAGYKEK